MREHIPDGVKFFVTAMRAKRRQLGFTQQQVADRAGIALATVNQIEGLKRPKTELASLEKIAYALNDTFEGMVWSGKLMSTDDVHKFRQKVGAALSDLRESKSLSRNAVAVRAEISPGYLADVELGKSSPTIDKIFKICQVLNVEPEFLFGLVKNTPNFD